MQVNDFNADAIISQLLLLDSTDPTKVWLLINVQCNLSTWSARQC